MLFAVSFWLYLFHLLLLNLHLHLLSLFLFALIMATASILMFVCVCSFTSFFSFCSIGPLFSPLPLTANLQQNRATNDRGSKEWKQDREKQCREGSMKATKRKESLNFNLMSEWLHAKWVPFGTEKEEKRENSLLQNIMQQSNSKTVQGRKRGANV